VHNAIENCVNGVRGAKRKKLRKRKRSYVLKIFISHIYSKTIIVKVNGGISRKRKDYLNLRLFFSVYAIKNCVNGVRSAKKLRKKKKSVCVLKIFISHICTKTIIMKVNGGIPRKQRDY